MKVNTSELKEKLKLILELQKREDISMSLFLELSEKALKYKEMIDYLEDEDIDQYLKDEEKDLDKTLLDSYIK